MYVLAFTKWKFFGYPLVNDWVPMLVAIMTYAIATRIMKVFVKEDGQVVRARSLIFFRSGDDTLSDRAIYIIYAYGILIGGVVSTIAAEVFSFFIHEFLTLNFPIFSSLVVLLANTIAAYCVVWSFEIEYGSKKIPPPATFQPQTLAHPKASGEVSNQSASEGQSKPSQQEVSDAPDEDCS